jgi:acyl-CoA synthetase (AMP-forming)/AMP-acid ligase II
MVRGPSVMDGYFGQPEATERVLRDGWLDTGDLGFELHGELYLTGRAKDVIILRGRNHAPAEVEHAADRVEGVRSGCTLAASFLPEGGSGERLVVLAEARREVANDRFREIAEEIARSVRGAAGLEPDHVEVLAPGTLPRTSSGKIRRGEGLRQWREGELAPARSFSVARMAGALVRSRLAMPRTRRGRVRG